MALLNIIPWQAWALLAVLAAGGAYHWHATSAAYSAGKAAALADVRAAGERSGRLADSAADAVSRCYATKGTWSRERGRCE